MRRLGRILCWLGRHQWADNTYKADPWWECDSCRPTPAPGQDQGGTP